MAWSFSGCTVGNPEPDSFLIEIEPSDGLPLDAGPNELGSSGSGTDYYYDTGTFQVGVGSDNCTWSITVAPSSTGPLSVPTTFTSSATGSSGSTQQFSVAGPWTMAWDYSCAASADDFVVAILPPVGDTSVDLGPNETGTGASGTNGYTDNGTFSLQVISNTCSWSITITSNGAAATTTTTTATSTTTTTTSTTTTGASTTTSAGASTTTSAPSTSSTTTTVLPTSTTVLPTSTTAGSATSATGASGPTSSGGDQGGSALGSASSGFLALTGVTSATRWAPALGAGMCLIGVLGRRRLRRHPVPGGRAQSDQGSAASGSMS